jgi:putative transposase
MARVAPLTDIKLSDLWKEVKEPDSAEFWGDLREASIKMVRELLERSLEDEMVYRLQAPRYGRRPGRRGWRNGHYYRDVVWEQGLIAHLRVPRARQRVVDSDILEKYRRRQGQINQLVKDMFLAGVSTRRVGEVLEPILGEAISASTVSNILKALQREVAAFLSRKIQDQFAYLLLDGITFKVKRAQGVQKKLVLVAYGIDIRGQRQLISFRLATAESEEQWLAFLNNLYERGLEGKSLRLIATDGCPGLHQALDTVYPDVPKQRCWAHKMRNVADKLPKRIQAPCLAGARKIYQAKTQREARYQFQQWKEEWGTQATKAVVCVEKDLDELLSFLKVPASDWLKVRTTNAIERSFREVRRRIRPMSCFNNDDSCKRIIYGVVSYLNAHWQNRYDSTHKY